MSELRPTRRQVVRAAGHTAWAAPVIVAASTAPASAASGTVNLDIVSLVADRTDLVAASVPFVQFAVQNNSVGSNAGPRTIRVTVTPSSGTAANPTLSPEGDVTTWSLENIQTVGDGFRCDAENTEFLTQGQTTSMPRIRWTGAGSGTVTVRAIVPASLRNGTAATVYPE